MSTGTIEKIKVNGTEHELAGMHLNDSGNREFYSEGTNTKGDPQKVNINSVGDIQIKTGDDAVLQFDCENNTTGDSNEYQFKVCNGAKDKTKRVIAAKVNVAEIILDNQNANTDDGAFSTDEIKVRYRHDKKNEAVYAKHMAASFDFRCVQRDGSTGRAHGGIALQIAGADNSGFENKVKLESNRTTAVDASASYSGEGGDGLEFGTFNNEHSSLFSGDYRFNVSGNVYPSTRVIETTESKTDYVTQDDDFKDIIDASRCANWGQIVDAASLLGISSKGNAQINNVGKYTYEANVNAKRANGDAVEKGYRELYYSNEAYYTDSSKYCYVAKKNATTKSGASATKGNYVLWSDASIYLANDSSVQEYLTSAEDETYYSTNDKWEYTKFWEQNDVNINLETSSKIKLQGNKLEILNEIDDVEEKMESVSIAATTYDLNSTDMVLDASSMNFAYKITKNGDESGHDPVITYTFTNNVYALDSSATFIANYKSAHEEPYPSDASLNEMYEAFKAKGDSSTYTVKLSELLSLVNTVNALSARVTALENA